MLLCAQEIMNALAHYSLSDRHFRRERLTKMPSHDARVKSKVDEVVSPRV